MSVVKFSSAHAVSMRRKQEEPEADLVSAMAEVAVTRAADTRGAASTALREGLSRGASTGAPWAKGLRLRRQGQV